MGAWNYGIFDNDTAYDFLEDVAQNPTVFFTTTIQQVKAADYVEYEDGIALLVTAAYIDNSINRTIYDNDNEDEESIENVNMFYRLKPKLQFGELIDDLKLGLRKVIGADSELNELWEENEELYPKWKGQIEGLLKRL